VRLTIYAYPWDLARLGVAESLQEIVDSGFHGVDVAATYHPIDAISPRGGARLFSDARGAVYFPARVDRYARIKPRLCSPEICATWPATAHHAAALGLGLNAWTITLFQPWIRDAHPDCARVLPSGDASGSAVCAANQDVREYLVALVEDFVDQFGVELVRLEGVMPHIFDLEWLRSRVLVAVPPLARALLNLCFCRACVAHAADDGLDVERLRRVINTTVEAELGGQPDEPGQESRVAALAAETELIAFAAGHARSSVKLVSEVRRRLAGRARISTTASTPYRALLGDMADDALVTRFIEAADQIALHPANPSGNQRVVDLNRRVSPPRELSMLFARVAARGAADGAHTSASAAEQLELDLHEAAARRVEEVTLYNFGLLRQRDVSDWATAVRAALS
jgi:hypothetical protein